MERVNEETIKGFAKVLVSHYMDDYSRGTLRRIAHYDAFHLYVENLILFVLAKIKNEASNGKLDGINGYYLSSVYLAFAGEIMVDRSFTVKVADYVRAALTS